MKMNSGDWPAAVGRTAVMMIVVCGTIVLPVLADDVHGMQDGGAALEERINAGDLKYRDSRTGEVVVATTARVAALRDELAPHFGQPRVFNRSYAADGTVSSEIGDAIRDVMVVRTNLDGTRETACVRTVDAAVAFIVGLDRAETKNGDGARRAAVR